MKHLTYFHEILYEMCTNRENLGPYFLFLKISNKNMAHVQIYVSGMTEAPLTLCHEVMRGKRPCKNIQLLLNVKEQDKKRAKTVISFQSDSKY